MGQFHDTASTIESRSSAILRNSKYVNCYVVAVAHPVVAEDVCSSSRIFEQSERLETFRYFLMRIGGGERSLCTSGTRNSI